MTIEVKEQMSDDEADLELQEFLRRALYPEQTSAQARPPVNVLRDAQYIYDNATDVAIDMRGTQNAAATIYESMQGRSYSMQTWREHELHPKLQDESTVHFIFLMDLLNFSFWSEESNVHDRFAIEFKGKKWTGYWALVAAIQRALLEGIPITSPTFWKDESQCSEEAFRKIFRSSSDEPMPMLRERHQCVREASHVLEKTYGGTFLNCIKGANGSASKLLQSIVQNFPAFDDKHTFAGRRVEIHKRAQILIADLWACFEGNHFGKFSDIDNITMFADYRIPQMLHSLGCITYSPPLSAQIRSRKLIESGHEWEIELRGCSIWCVELIKREITKKHPKTHVNAVLIDFYLYDKVKELEAQGLELIPHHRTRSIYY